MLHNKIRDALGGLAALGYREIIHEPVVHDGNEVSSVLVADFRIWGVWTPQAETLFDYIL